MLQQETSADQRWNNGMTEQGVNGWTMTEVGDDQVGLQYGWSETVQHAIRLCVNGRQIRLNTDCMTVLMCHVSSVCVDCDI